MIVQKAVQVHAGTIHFESEINQGTTFTITLPHFHNGTSVLLYFIKGLYSFLKIKVLQVENVLSVYVIPYLFRTFVQYAES